MKFRTPPVSLRVLSACALAATVVVATGCTAPMGKPTPVTQPVTSPANPTILPVPGPTPQPAIQPVPPTSQPTILPVPGPAPQPVIQPVRPAPQPSIQPVPSDVPKPTTLPSGPQPVVRDAVPSALNNPSRRPCTAEWFSYLEKHYAAVGDAQGHGPDLGSDEWLNAFERRRNLPSTSALPREQRCATLARELDYRN
ncbi:MULTISPECIES: hypothetical protein [Pandoraea]|uniref:hypothetical protein n=1 Tax=Pandoraea TaxID=93217 RepID=UPI001F5DDC1B|nr:MULTISPECIES: hypothetical protein [Pandoraea]